MSLRDVARRARIPRPRGPGPHVSVGPLGQLEDLRSLVPRADGRRVLIVADRSQGKAVKHWIREFADDEVVVVSTEENPEWGLPTRHAHFMRVRNQTRLERRLKIFGRLDVLVSLTGEPTAPGQHFYQYAMFAKLLGFVSVGGLYVVDREAAPTPSAVLGLERLTALLAAAEDRDLARSLRGDEVELARSVGAVILTRRRIIVTKRHHHYLLLRDNEVDKILSAREPDAKATRLDVLPAGQFEARAEFVGHGTPARGALPSPSIWHPPLNLRHYEGKLGSSAGQLLFTGSTILPDSFRWPQAGNPRNNNVHTCSSTFGRIDSQYVPRRTLEGSYFFLDASNSGHFGHVTTEVVSRLWAWDRAKAADPELKAIFHRKPDDLRRPVVELALFTAYGIAESDITWMDEPVWLTSVFAATPMWHNQEPYYVHPSIADVWRRMTDSLLADAGDAPRHDRIFVSRGRHLLNRICRNREAVERFFAARDFQIVFPEQLSFPEQAATFAHARVVAGFGGSGMFNLMHARRLETTIVLSHDAYTARNEHLFASVLGGRLHYFWSPADHDSKSPRSGDKASWSFDFDQHAADLDAVLVE